MSCLFRTFLQLLKFGVSGILGVFVSTLLFYGLKSRLPDLFWIYRLDVIEMAFYVLTSVIGGTVHFILSKVWVFEK